MALNQEILPLAMLRKHLWDKAAEIQTSEEWNNPTPVILLLLTKYIYVDSVDVHLHRCVQTHTDAVVYAPGWPDTSQLWSGSLSRTASQNTGGNQVHRTGLPLPGSESAWGQTYTCFSTYTAAVVAQQYLHELDFSIDHNPLSPLHFFSPAQCHYLHVQMIKTMLQAIFYSPIMVSFQQLHVKGKALGNQYFNFTQSVLSFLSVFHFIIYHYKATLKQ